MATLDDLPFVQDAVSENTLLMLKNYQQRGFDARTFMLREHSKMLAGVKAGQGQYADYTPSQRHFVESCIYVELLNRLCLLLEDFADLCYALSGDLREFPKKIFSQKNPRTILREFSHEQWFSILRYAEITSLDISEEDKTFLRNIRGRNVEHLQMLVDLFVDFLDYHWLFYTKHKHGNPLIYGIEPVEINGEPTLFIPATYNQKNPRSVTGVFVSNSTYLKWQRLLDVIVTLSKEFVDRTLLFIERNGVPIVEHIVYAKITELEIERLRKISEKCNENIERIQISIELRTNVHPKEIERHNDLYAKFDDVSNSLLEST